MIVSAKTNRVNPGSPTESSAEVMGRLHTELVRDEYRPHCETVALAVAEALILEGKEPIMVHVSAHDGGFLHPVQFNGRVQWKTHAIVFCEGQAYDPLLKGSVLEDQYGFLAFGKEVVRESIAWTTETLREILKRPNKAG